MARHFSCSDGLCGADDCRRCHPELWIEEDKYTQFAYEPRDRFTEDGYCFRCGDTFNHCSCETPTQGKVW